MSLGDTVRDTDGFGCTITETDVEEEQPLSETVRFTLFVPALDQDTFCGTDPEPGNAVPPLKFQV